MYTILIEYRPTLGRADQETLVRALGEYEPRIHPTSTAFEVVLSVKEETLEKATGIALKSMRLLGGRHEAASLKVLQTQVWEQQQSEVSLPDLVGVTEAAEALNVSRQRIFQMVEEGKLPNTRANRIMVFPKSTIEQMRIERLRISVIDHVRASEEAASQAQA